MAEGNGSSRIALVTGAARGIGWGIALRLAADGLDMAVNDIGVNADQLEGAAEELVGTGWRMGGGRRGHLGSGRGRGDGSPGDRRAR